MTQDEPGDEGLHRNQSPQSVQVHPGGAQYALSVEAQQKLLNGCELKPERVEMFEQLLKSGEKYRHMNQYQ